MTLEQDDIDGIRALYNSRPVALFGFACSGVTCSFDGTASTDDLGIVSYSWTFGDGAGVSGAAVSHAFAAAGAYNVQLSVVDGDGHVAALTRVVTVPDPPPVAAFTLSCSSNLRCSGDAAGSTDNADIVSYAWTWGDGLTSSGVRPTHTYAAPATYLVTLTVTDNSGNTDNEAQPASVHFPLHTVGYYDAAIPEFQLRAGHEGSGTGAKAAISGFTGRPVAGDWNSDGVDTVGLFDPAQGRFVLRNSGGTGPPDSNFTFGPKNGQPLAGDWQNKGHDNVGVYGPAAGAFQLRLDSGSLSFSFTGAAAAWIPIAGDWNCDGTDTVGLYDPATATFHLRTSNTTGGDDLTFVFGTPGAGLLPLAGDWDGNGCDGVGVYSPASATFNLRNATSAGPADHTFSYGPPGKLPIAGDWDDQ
jgi:chitodextrinase